MLGLKLKLHHEITSFEGHGFEISDRILFSGCCDGFSSFPVDPSNFRLGIVSSQFNQSLVISLLHRVTEVIEENGTPLEVINETVPGANEIPSAMALILEKKALSRMIALGVVIKGSTASSFGCGVCGKFFRT